MAVSGWFVALVALGVVPLVATGDPAVFWLWLLFVVVVGSVDVAIAGSPRRVGVEPPATRPGAARRGRGIHSARHQQRLACDPRSSS